MTGGVAGAAAEAPRAALGVPHADAAGELSLDVVICTYDNARLLDRTLDALGRQRVPPGVRWRVLVVDNRCTDDTPAVVERHRRLGRFPLRRVEEPVQGLTPARVRGVRETDGAWVAFVDDDCLLAEDWVAEAARFAAAHPECGAFGGRVVLEWEAPPPRHALSVPYAYAGRSRGDAPARVRSLAGAGLVVRRAALEATGWPARQFLADRTGARLVSGGDAEIVLRLAARHEVWYTPACVLRHVIPERRLSRAYLRRIVAGLGASRHNATALTWRRGYPAWLAYSALASLVFALECTLDLRRRPGIGPAIAYSPVRGWWAAMWAMWRMDPDERRALLGVAAPAGAAR